MDKEKFIKIFTERLHVEIDTFINNDSCSEQDETIGRIKGIADCIRYINRQKDEKRV